jgi:hypothetical protein
MISKRCSQVEDSLKVLLHGWQKNHFIYDGFVDCVGKDNVTSYLPRAFNVNYGDVADTYDSSEIFQNAEDYGLILFTPRSLFDVNFSRFLGMSTSAPKVFMDLEDDFFLRNIYKSPHISYYFKRELYSSLSAKSTVKWYFRYLYGSQILPPIHRRIGVPLKVIDSFPYKIAYASEGNSKLRPLSLTIRNDSLTTTSIAGNREIDLFFCLTLSTVKDRHEYFRKVRKWLSGQVDLKSFVKNGGVPKDLYVRNLVNSKAAISLRGMGFDTDRYWEIPALGAVLFSQRLPLVIDHDFIDGESAIYFHDFPDFSNQFVKYVVKSDEWKEIARRGRENFLRFHTPKSRARYIMDTVGTK